MDMAADRRSVSTARTTNQILINQGEDDQMEIVGYRRSDTKTALTWFFILITAGLLRLFFYWFPHLMVRATQSACSLAEADTVILKDQYEQYFVSKVKCVTQNGTLTQPPKSDPRRTDSRTSSFASMLSSRTLRYFVTKKVKYLWSEEYSTFQKLRGIDDGVACAYFHQLEGQTYEEVNKRRVLYGMNSITVHVTPIIKLLFKEALSPFYIFQLFSCLLWYFDEYEVYATCIVVMSCLSIGATLYQTRKMQRALRNTIQSSTIVSVCRGGNEYHEISSDDLVPGDVIEVPRGGCLMQCDAVLVTGNCIVNESMLTGESVPVTKTPLPNPKTTHEDSGITFNVKDHARHILFCGTHVIQTRFYGGQKVKAVVFRTGFSTAKGDLVRSILYPKPVDFKFNKDTYKFVGVLAAIALAGFIFTIILMVHRGEDPSDIVLRSLDLITIAVPPALPAALTVGIVFAQSRMKGKKIYCISPRSINVCGSLNTVCFDKTGTLTEDGLNMHSIVSATDGKFESEIQNINLLKKGHFMVGMATCHSLTIIDGVLSGDPLELIMFESIGWELNEPGQETSRFDVLCPTIVYPKSANKTGYDVTLADKSNNIDSEEYGIVRQFTFSSSLQRMSVVVRRLGADHFDLYAKGAPEMIASLCVPDTVPDDFHDILMGYTKHGYRVLALAYKPLPVKLKYPKLQRIQREQVERGLTFIGLIVMENRLKPETTPVIKKLQEADIRTIMVTGDNMLTALSVARECGMVGRDDQIILVQAFPPGSDDAGDKGPYVEYINTSSTQDKVAVKEMAMDGTFDIEAGLSRPYHFAVTGKSWLVLRQFFPDLIEKVSVRGTIFARMSPDQKAQLVESLQDLGYYVGMCGDGANDCGALKSAHAGISLSEAEASVASPFTSKTPNISCIPNVIIEGRAALVTSFGIFKFMACYSLVQFTSVLILYWVGINLADYQFLYIDLFLLTTLSITFGRTGPYPEISRDPPTVSLLSLAPICSLIFQMVIMIAVQVIAYLYVMEAEWFVPWVENPEDDYDFVSYEGTTVFICSAYQYIILGIIFSKGRPYRQTIFSNLWFVCNLALCIGITLWVNVYPAEFLVDILELMMPPSVPYRLLYGGLAVINFLLCLLLEMYILDSQFMTVTLQNKISRLLPGSRLRHEEVELTLRAQSSWPPVKDEVLAGTFKRLDSAFQSVSAVNLTADDDSFSLSGSETGSLNGEYMLENTDLDDVKLIDKKDKGYQNVAFELDEGAANRFSTRL